MDSSNDKSLLSLSTFEKQEVVTVNQWQNVYSTTVVNRYYGIYPKYSDGLK